MYGKGFVLFSVYGHYRLMSAHSHVTSQTDVAVSPVSLCTVFAQRASAPLVQRRRSLELLPARVKPVHSVRRVVRQNQTKGKNIRTGGPTAATNIADIA